MAFLVLCSGTPLGTHATEIPDGDPLVLSGNFEERLQLVNGWRYHPGDDPEWADPAFDDSSWPVASSRLRVGDDPPPGGWSGIGWFRRRLQLADGMPPTALAIRIEQLGASEIYLDGHLVNSVGTVSSDPKHERPVYPNDFAGIALEPGRTHVLAVRFSNSRDNLYVGAFRGFGLNLRSVESAAASYHRWSRTVLTIPMAFAGAFAALAVLHLLLFVFHRSSREHIFFSLFATALVGDFALQAAQLLETDLITRLRFFKLNLGVSVAYVVIGLVLVNMVFRRRPEWTTWILTAGGVVMVATVSTWDAFRSTAPLQIYFVLAFLEMLRVSVRALFQRVADAWMVAAAFTVLAMTALLETTSRIVGRPFPLQAVIMDASTVMVVLAFSVFISRRAARTAEELEVRLVEVEELSQRAVEQERRAVREETERRILEAEHERRSEELEAARRLQLAMLPRTATEIPGLDLAYRMLTATEVGGDYVDVRIVDGGRTLVVAGDATSHGLQAGMVVAVAKSLFHGTSSTASPGEVLSQVGAGLQSLRERYASMAMVVVAVEEGRLQVASAGMPPVLVRRGGSGEVEEVLLPGVPLGTLADADYPVRQVPIGSGDVVLMMSDGLIEEVDASGNAFGYGRVASYLKSCDVSSAEVIVDGLLDSATAYVGSSPPHDDVTILAMIIE